ncbi:hypothetical protein MKW94_012906 [Papaver nudicaule]|uniref:C3H1-type domain-containing protein n=1 Tax=Papaver nudicaule TaxID=74823 RepID=A0AA41VJG8_PAPNU|nr:hypothetical protein [Papaver nudicaule]
MGFQPAQFPPTGNGAPMFWPQGGPVENGKQSNYSMGSNYQNQDLVMNQGRMTMPPPPQNPNQNPNPLGKMFFMTRLCLKFQAGYCPYGNNCSYAHGVENMREPPLNWQKVVASHEDDLTVLQTACPFGDKCNFVHRHIEDCREESRFRESSSITGLHNYGAIEFAKFIPNTNDTANGNAAVVSTKKQVVIAKY